MARSGFTHLNDIKEKFCQYPLCPRQCSEPKLLPCLHRYCRNCLKQLIERNQRVTVINCPECKHEFTIPMEGVDGFKTDFYMKNVIEHVELQKSLENEQLQECCDCLKKLKVKAYCFKCNGFLCKGCHNSHMTKRSLKDHKHHTLSVEDLKSKCMTLEKLSDLREAPRCQNHPEDLCRLCCATCDNLPICVACVHGRHKNHEINDVKIIATKEREKITNEIKNINKYMERILKFPEEVNRVKINVTANLTRGKEMYVTKHRKDTQKTQKEIEKLEEVYQLRKSEIETNRERELMKKRKQMDEEIKQLHNKYDDIFDNIKEQSEIKLDSLKHKHDEDLQKCSNKLAVLEAALPPYIKILENRLEERLKILQKISQQIDEVIERCKMLTKTGYSVLKTTDDWTALLCISNIRKAIEILIKDMGRDFPELKILSRNTVVPYITGDEESPVNIKDTRTNDWRITGIAVADDGSVVISGWASVDLRCQSHITVVSLKGEVLRKRELVLTRGFLNRYCAFLSEFKVVTVCNTDEIGIFDIRDASYMNKNITGIFRRWVGDRSVTCVTCVATDPVKNHIFVGRYNSREVYVYDDQLTYHHTLTLEKKVQYPYDMAISEGYLLICDLAGGTAYVVHREGLKSNLIHKFTKPGIGQDWWKPLSVCTDSQGFIYILWTSEPHFIGGRRVVAQYSQDGRQLLTEKQIDCTDARCVATVKTENTEKLLVASLFSGKLHIYNLM